MAKQTQVIVSTGLYNRLCQTKQVRVIDLKKMGEETLLLSVESDLVVSDRLFQDIIVIGDQIKFVDHQPLWDDV